MSDLITKIPEDTRHEWVVTVDDEVISNVRIVRIVNPRFGSLQFGKRPEGPSAIGWIWKEIGGGGVGVVPFFVAADVLYVGMVKQERHCQGGLVWNIPRGFLDPGLTHIESAVAETSEELGLNASERLIPLQGESSNSNSTFFDTSDTGAGFRYYGLRIHSKEVDMAVGPPYPFKEGSIRPLSTMGERIVSARFFLWSYAAQVGDQFSNTGAARLIARFSHLARFIH